MSRNRLTCDGPGLQRIRAITALTTGMLSLQVLVPASAAVDVGVDIELGVIRTDNLLLAPDGEEQSETVYTIAPEFYLTSDDQRLQANVRYQPQALLYSEFDDADEVYHNVDASLTAALVRDRLFLELNGANFQSIADPEQRVPSGNLSLTANRTESRVLQASPYWQQRIGQADLLIRGTYTDFSYDDERFQSSNGREGLLQLGNIERQQGFAWQLDYSIRRTEYDISDPWEFQRAALNLGVWVNDSTRLFVAGGAETAFDNLFESNLDADFWEAGFQYAPNQRLNLELAAGDRSYGTSFRGNFSYELKRGQISMRYTENPANRSDLVLNRHPLVSFDNLDGMLDRPGDSDRFVQKRGEMLVRIELAKSDFTLRAFSDIREERITAEGDPLDDDELAGLAAGWRWRFGTKTTLGIGGDIADRSYSGRDDELWRARLDVEYQFSQKFSVRVELVRFDQNGQGSSDNDYTENQTRLFLNASF